MEKKQANQMTRVCFCDLFSAVWPHSRTSEGGPGGPLQSWNVIDDIMGTSCCEVS